jgi:hypothetical protein
LEKYLRKTQRDLEQEAKQAQQQDQLMFLAAEDPFLDPEDPELACVVFEDPYVEYANIKNEEEDLME